MNDLDTSILQDPPPPAARRPRITLGSVVLLAGIAALALVVALQLARRQQGPIDSGLAPDFSATTFDGRTFRLSDLRGQIVVLNFWASWCAPCREEAPELQALWQAYEARDVIVLGIAWSDVEADSRRFMEEFGLTYWNAPDIGTRIGDDYSIRAVPETYIIDRNGEVVQRLIGSTNVTFAFISGVIEPLLTG
jgi:cytochrome c biogenesis protein CcmG/thiol:disulfide interchange protein DsbE